MAKGSDFPERTHQDEKMLIKMDSNTHLPYRLPGSGDLSTNALEVYPDLKI
jgi:hypothetical protein